MSESPLIRWAAQSAEMSRQGLPVDPGQVAELRGEIEDSLHRRSAGSRVCVTVEVPSYVVGSLLDDPGWSAAYLLCRLGGAHSGTGTRCVVELDRSSAVRLAGLLEDGEVVVHDEVDTSTLELARRLCSKLPSDQALAVAARSTV